MNLFSFFSYCCALFRVLFLFLRGQILGPSYDMWLRPFIMSTEVLLLYFFLPAAAGSGATFLLAKKERNML